MTVNSITTNQGKNIILNRAYSASPIYTPPSKFKVGIGQTSASAVTTDLTLPVPISGTETVDACDVTTGWTASASDSVSLNTAIYVEGVAALNLIKGNTGTNYAYVSKSATAKNFTSKKIWIYIYISDILYPLLKTSGTALEIRYGTDSSNYYKKTYTAADLVIGGNNINFSSATATSTVGSPTITSCGYVYIQYFTELNATVTVANDFVYDNIVVASSDDYLQTFVSSYPIFDYTANETTIRCYLTSVEANGYNLNTIGYFNTDGSPIMSDIDVFNDESKTFNDEFIFIRKNRIL